MSSFYDFHRIKEEYVFFFLLSPIAVLQAIHMLIIASTDLQKEIVEGERVRSHTQRSKTDRWVFFIFNKAAFVSHFPRLAYGGEKSSSARLTLLCCSAGEGRSHHQGVLRQKLPLDRGAHLCCQGCGMGSHRDGVRVLRLSFI